MQFGDYRMCKKMSKWVVIMCFLVLEVHVSQLKIFGFLKGMSNSIHIYGHWIGLKIVSLG